MRCTCTCTCIPLQNTRSTAASTHSVVETKLLPHFVSFVRQRSPQNSSSIAICSVSVPPPLLAVPSHASSTSSGRMSQSTSRAVSVANQGQTQRNVAGNTNEKSSTPKAEAMNSSPTTTNTKQSLFADEESWNLQLIASNSPECEDIRRRCPQFEIETVYAVRNAKIEQRYMDAVAQTLENGTFKAFHPVWHGTTADDAIARTGFRVGGVDVERKHGSAMGVGVYVTTEPRHAASYSGRRTAKFQTIFRMLFCELCETTDTIVQPGSKVFVQPNRRLVRPMYVLHFRYFDRKLRHNTPKAGPNVLPFGINPNAVIAKATVNPQPSVSTSGTAMPSTNAGVIGNNQNTVQPNVTCPATGSNTVGPAHTATNGEGNSALKQHTIASFNSSGFARGNSNPNAEASSHNGVAANTSNAPRSSAVVTGPSNVNEVTPKPLAPLPNRIGVQPTSAGTNANDDGKLNLKVGANTSAMPNGNAVPSRSNAAKMGASDIRNLRKNITARWVERNREIYALRDSNLGAQPTNVANTSPAITSKNWSLFDDEESWNLQLISSKSPEYDDIRKRCAGLEIEAVYAVRNTSIEERYMDAVAKTLENETFKAFHSVWHATEAADDIVRSGFGVGGMDVQRKHGSAMGAGVYVTTQPKQAAQYARNRMIFCDLCETTDTSFRTDRHMFVQPNKRLVRPLYVVHFRN